MRRVGSSLTFTKNNLERKYSISCNTTANRATAAKSGSSDVVNVLFKSEDTIRKGCATYNKSTASALDAPSGRSFAFLSANPGTASAMTNSTMRNVDKKSIQNAFVGYSSHILSVSLRAVNAL